MRKNWLALLLAFAIALMLCACGRSESPKTATINGQYDLESVVYEGFYMSADSTSSSPSYVSVTPAGKNLLASVYLVIEDDNGLLSGHLSEETKKDECIKYKFWIDSVVGDLMENADWIYINYYPDTDSIEINASGDVSFEFVKNK